MYSLFPIVTQGSPKVALFAVIVKLFLPSAAVCTTETELLAWQEPMVKLPQLPFGKP